MFFFRPAKIDPIYESRYIAQPPIFNYLSCGNGQYAIASTLSIPSAVKKKSEKNNIANSEEEKYVYLYSGKHIHSYLNFINFIKFERCYIIM